MTTISMTIKEAEAIEAELNALVSANENLSAKLAADKTAGDKTAADKTAGDIANILVNHGLISPSKAAGAKAALMQSDGIVSYFKKACDLYVGSQGALKEAEARLKEIPARIGRVHADKVASEKPQTALEAASARFAQRVLAAH